MTEINQRLYLIEINRLNNLVERLTRENSLLKSQLKESSKGCKSSQIARLFLPKILWK